MADEVRAYTREQLDALNPVTVLDGYELAVRAQTAPTGTPEYYQQHERFAKEIGKVVRVIRDLRDMARAGLADSERLDWLDKNGHSVSTGYGEVHLWVCDLAGVNPHGTGDTWREAIDAARDRQSGSPTPAHQVEEDRA